ncbi:hypothetical protein [Pedobacter nyackensis]|uniref:hypothetical protein n=1 Tax=Pedobacter nyackensis TaxID=475255 RepID=UPI0029307380|nr:hypothetical protein [Pedobacter nyackensis]
MKAAIVFFFSLCFLLLKGHTDVYAAIHDDSFSYSSAQHVEKKQQTHLETTNQDLPVIKDASLNSKKDEFVSLENEDDDDSMFSRKYVLLTKYFITLAYASVLVCFYNYFKNRLPFCRHLSYSSSYKYILQRVLRL